MVGVSSTIQKYAENGSDLAKGQSAQTAGITAVNKQMLAIWKRVISESPKLEKQIGRINKSFGKMAGVIGKTLVPAATDLADFMAKLATKFQGLPGWAKKGIAILFVLVSALIGVSMVVMTVIPALGAMATTLSLLGTAASAVVGVIPIVTALFSAFLGPILLIVGALGLLYLAWKNNLFGIQDKAKKAFAFIKGLFNKFVGFIKPFWDKFLGDALAGRWGEALGTIFKLLAATAAKLVKIWYALRIRILAAVAKLGARLITNFGAMLAKTGNGVARGINGIIATFENGFNQALDGLNGFVSKFVGGINDVLTALNKLDGVNLGTVSAVEVGSVSLGRLETKSDTEIEQRAKKKLEARLSMIEQAKQQSLDNLDSIEQWFMSKFINEGAEQGASSGDTHNFTKVQLQPGAVQVQGTGDSETDMEYAAQKASQIIGEQVGSRGGVQ